MGIRNISLLIDDDQTVQDILDGFNNGENIAMVCIDEGGIGHAYIEEVDPDFLHMRVKSSSVVKREYGFVLYLEV